MKLDFEEIKRRLSGKAKEYASDKKKTKDLLDEAIKKAKKDGPLAEIWEYLQLMFGMIKDWISGEYTKIPTNIIISIIIGLLYFVAPIDIIPDFIPGFGVVDDAAVLGFIIKEIKDDLNDYKEWKNQFNIANSDLNPNLSIESEETH